MMSQRGLELVLRPLALVIMVLAAGCASPVPEVALEAEAWHIEGVVVDDAITPLANATITVVGTNLTASSDVDGRFSIEVPEPGIYVLRVTQAGHIPQETEVNVADAEELVQVKLTPIAVPVPTASVKEWNGILQCGLRTPQDGYAVCKLADDLTGVIGDDADERYQDIDSPPTFLQVEMEWTSTQPLGSSLRLMLTDDHRQGLDNYAVATGNSPLMINADNETLRFKHLDTQGVYIRVFTGDYEDLGASLTLQQTFTVYTTIFQDYRPGDAWRFTDGNGVPPS